MTTCVALFWRKIYYALSAATFRLEDWLRPAMFIPESKPLNVLLREFRISHTHMALVIDEFGSLAGLVTIEDVLEEIVGEIEDEHDAAQLDTDIQLDASGRYRVKAQTPVDAFNEKFLLRTGQTRSTSDWWPDRPPSGSRCHAVTKASNSTVCCSAWCGRTTVGFTA